MNTSTLHVPYEQLADFCRKNQIEYLALFGSAARGELRADSDVDLLVEFDPAVR
jgi:predicted nucleotidyltransferase